MMNKQLLHHDAAMNEALCVGPKSSKKGATQRAVQAEAAWCP